VIEGGFQFHSFFSVLRTGNIAWNRPWEGPMPLAKRNGYFVFCVDGLYEPA